MLCRLARARLSIVIAIALLASAAQADSRIDPTLEAFKLYKLDLR